MRSAVVKEHGLCSNSLSNDHMLNKFKFEISCKVKSYDKRQHTLLHNPNYARGNILRLMNQLMGVEIKTLITKIFLKQQQQ